VGKRLAAPGIANAGAISALVLSASLFCCIAAGAQEQRVALVIGNGGYQHNAPLDNPPNDATDIAAALRKDGFTVTLLIDATRIDMEQSVRAFGNGLKNRDAIGMFYYSGHGAQAEGNNFLVPVDADIQDSDELAYKAVNAESILAKMRSAGNKINIVVLDACRDNPFPGSSRSGDKGLAIVTVKVPESVIVFATDPGSTAADGTGRNSPFTRAFLENMDAPGQDITTMLKRVTSRVRQDTDGKQTPWVSTNLTRDFAFAPSSGSQGAATVQPDVSPTISVTRLYGSLVVAAMTDGTLYLDGREIGEVPAQAHVKLDQVEVGDRSVELHYADGQVEQQGATVKAGSAGSVEFRYRPDFFKLARTGRPQDVQSAIRTGAEVNARNSDGWTALMLAARDNPNLDVIVTLLKSGADLSARDPRYDWPALMWAAADNQNPDVITALLSGGAKIDAHNVDGETALMAASANSQNPAMILLLLRAGADAKAKDGAGRTAFDYAQGNEKLKGTAAFLKLKEASFTQAQRHFLYVTNNGSNNVSAYAVSPITGALAAVTGSRFPVGTSPNGIAVEPTGKRLYVANAASDNVSAFTINPKTGALKEISGSPFAGSTGPEGIVIDPSGKLLFTANNNSYSWHPLAHKELVSVSALNSITGAMSLGSLASAGVRPRSIAIEPKGRFLYVANSDSDDVSAFTITVGTGALSSVGGSPFPAEKAPYSVTVDPGGAFVYVANKDSANVSAFSINQGTGALSKVVGSPFRSGAAPRGVAADPTGRYLYVANSGSANLSAYVIDRSTGAISEIRGSPFQTGTAPVSVTADPTGEFVYVANNGSATISVYAIDPGTGALSEIRGSPFPTGVAPSGVAVAEVTSP
jgi:6-phosphogluconolactonase (cycloisomerase 2 family)/uncharacterized caspase-like protein